MEATAAETTRLILAACQPSNSAENWQAKFDTVQADWEDLVVRAIVLGLAPQLYTRLQSWPITPPARALAKLAVTYKAQAARNHKILSQLDELLLACKQAGIRPIALKGAHLAHTYYPNPAQRPMNDIDLLFTPEEMPQVAALLQKLGYVGKYKSPEFGAGVTKHTSSFGRTGAGQTTANPYLSADRVCIIEPHISLEESWYGLRVDITPGVRERAEETVLGCEPVRVLATADLLLHICLHFCFHLIQGAPAMVQLADLAVICRVAPVDWRVFSARARNTGAAHFALAALSAAHKLLDAPLPDGILAQLEADTPARLRPRMTAVDLRQILQRTQQKPFNTLSGRLRRGIQDRAETARWAATFGDQCRIWATLLQAWRSDTAQMLLSQTKR